MSAIDQLAAVAVAQGSQTGVTWAGLGQGWMDRLAGEISSAGLPLNSSSNALEAFRVVKAGAGTLFGFTVFNNKNAAQFIQLHDARELPADGAVPVFTISVATVTDRGVAWVIPGRFFTRGIILCNSSTLATKTIASADCFFDVQYI